VIGTVSGVALMSRYLLSTRKRNDEQKGKANVKERRIAWDEYKVYCK
jgi:hypothetical protein